MNHSDTFYQLHHNKKPLIIANAWNARSAQLIEQAGFPAIATSSGAISNSMGYPDGEKMPFSELLYIIRRIKASTTIPLTVDFERGYSDDPGEVIANLQQLIDTGVSGINLEDNQGEELFLKKLSAIKEHLQKNNYNLFINARTDGFLQKAEAPVQTTIRRAKLYKAAGADGLFVTGISDLPTIREIASSIELPLNVVALPAISSVTDLSDAGVKRISMAVMLYKAAYTPLESSLKKVLESRSLNPLY